MKYKKEFCFLTVLILLSSSVSLFLREFNVPLVRAAGIEDLTTWSISGTDAGSVLSVTTLTDSFTQAERQDDFYVYKEISMNNFSILLDFTLSDLEAGDVTERTAFTIVAVTSKTGNMVDLDTDGKQIALYIIQTTDIDDQFNFALVSKQDGVADGYEHDATAYGLDTYYIKLQRVDTNLNCKIYDSESDRSTDTDALESLSIDCFSTITDYVMISPSEKRTGDPTDHVSGSISNVQVISETGTTWTDLSTWSEFDPNGTLSQDTSIFKLDVTDLDRPDHARWTVDNTTIGDFDIFYKIRFSEVAYGSGGWNFFLGALTQSNESVPYHSANDEDAVALLVHRGGDNSEFYLSPRATDNGDAIAQNVSTLLDCDVTYYLRWWSDSGIYYVRIWTGNWWTGSLIANAQTNTAADLTLRYESLISNGEYGDTGVAESSGYIMRHKGVVEEESFPYEYLKDYVEEDAANRFDIFSYSADVDNLLRSDSDHNLYTDGGVDYYADFALDFDLIVTHMDMTSGTYWRGMIASFSDEAGQDYSWHDDNNKHIWGLVLHCQNAGATYAVGILNIAGTSNNHGGTVANLAVNTQYYLTLSKTKDVAKLIVYSDSNRETQVGLTEHTLNRDYALRYFYALQSMDSSGDYDWCGTVANYRFTGGIYVESLTSTDLLLWTEIAYVSNTTGSHKLEYDLDPLFGSVDGILWSNSTSTPQFYIPQSAYNVNQTLYYRVTINGYQEESNFTYTSSPNEDVLTQITFPTEQYQGGDHSPPTVLSNKRIWVDPVSGKWTIKVVIEGLIGLKWVLILTPPQTSQRDGV